MVKHVVLTLTLAVAARGQLTRVLLDTTVHPLSVCNDGTPAGYYYKAGTSNDWVVFQQGGGWCYDAKTCASRTKSLTSSSGWKPTMTPEQGGILDSNDPQLAAAHIVYAPYCSSDGWAGSAAAAPPTGFAFRGHDIVEGIFRDLVTTRGLGAVPGTRVMYGGCSAGARGALFNLDHVALSLLPSIVSPFSNIERIGGLLDSAFWVDIPQLPSAHEPSFEDQARDVLALANASVSEASACRAAYPTEGWKCIYGQFAIPFVRSDFILHAFQYDLFQLQGDTGVSVPNKTPQELAYCETFRNTTRASARTDVVFPNGPGKNAAHLPACFKHCNTESSTFASLKTNGVSLEEHIVSWFFGGSTAQYIIEDCNGFSCGSDCPPV